MQVTLEDFVPYDESIYWRISDAYFANRGIAAWTGGEIPYFSTNNYAFARQNAEFVVRLAAALGRTGALKADEPVYVLEVGSGLGQFAGNFLRALEQGCGAAGRRLAKRVRFVLSDYAETNVRQAVKTRALAGYVDRGQVVPALFDLRKPGLRDLDGKPFEVPLVAAVANYICDVTPMKVLRKNGATFAEKYVQLVAEVEDAEPLTREQAVERFLGRSTENELMKPISVEVEWRTIDLDERIGPEHADAVRALLAIHETATVGWYGVFLDALGALRKTFKPGGVFTVNDYGSCEVVDLAGEKDVPVRHYGNSMSHPVNFSIFDAWTKRTGIGLIRTRHVFRSLHTASIVYGEVSPAHKRMFKLGFINQQPAEDLLDFSASARTHVKGEEYLRAIRLYQRCVQLDPASAEMHYRLGEACLSATYNLEAYKYLLTGKKLDVELGWDFEFQLGRACHRLHRYREAERWYKLSLQREDHHVTHLNLALVYQDLKDWRRAYLSVKESLKLSPEYERAQKLVTEIRTEWCDAMME